MTTNLFVPTDQTCTPMSSATAPVTVILTCVSLSLSSGHPEYLLGLIESLGMVAERDTGQWIASQGGWVRIFDTLAVLYLYLQ